MGEEFNFEQIQVAAHRLRIPGIDGKPFFRHVSVHLRAGHWEIHLDRPEGMAVITVKRKVEPLTAYQRANLRADEFIQPYMSTDTRNEMFQLFYEEERQRDSGVLSRANARIAEETKGIPSDDPVRFEETVTRIYREEEKDAESNG